MQATQIGKGDKVVIVRGEGRNLVDEKNKPLVCSVLQVNHAKGHVYLEVPRPKAKRGEREKPVRGAEVWKTVRYNPKSGEAGGLKIIKRPIRFANLRVVEKGPRKDWSAKA